MKTGYQNIELADDTYQFYFQKNGEALTKYDTKIKKFTVAGLVMKPTNDDDNNYGAITGVTVNSDGTYNVGKKVGITTNYDDMTKGGILVNKQGTVIKDKTVKDENDQYWKTDKNGKIVKSAPDKDKYDEAKKAKKW